MPVNLQRLMQGKCQDHLYQGVNQTEHMKRNNVMAQQVIVGVLTPLMELKYRELRKDVVKEKSTVV